MAEPVTTGMTERALMCMQPEKFGGCEETEHLVAIHYKVTDPDTGKTITDTILGWLCQAHALKLALKNSRTDLTVPMSNLDVTDTTVEE